MTAPGPRLVGVALVVRIVVAVGLVAGPWTDSADELAGWDVERFAEIDRAGDDEAVEYPPGTVVLIESASDGTAPGTLAGVVLLAVVADLAIGALLARWWGRSAAAWYLVVSVPLLVTAYVRLDLVATAAALLAAGAIARRRAGLTAVAVGTGLLLKTFPPLVAVIALARGRERTAVAAVAGGVVAMGLWVGVGGVDGVRDVVSFRDATGWHVSSTGGLLTVLLDGGEAVKESGSFRLGEVPGWARVLGLLVTVVVAGVAGVLRRGRWDSDAADAAAVLAVLGTLLVTAPLFSPQFVLWLLPFVAVLLASGATIVAAPFLGAALATQAIVSAFGPDSLDAPLPALLLLVRTAVLVLGVAVALRSLSSPGSLGRPARGSTGRSARV